MVIDPDSALGMAYERRVRVATFSFPWEGELAAARLRAEGVEAVLADENLIRLDWFVSHAVGGVKVLVPASQADRATELLAEQHLLPEIGLATAADGGEPHCPGCGSANLNFERWSRAGFVGSLLFFGFPLPIPRSRWRCGSCKRIFRRHELAR